MWCTQHWCERSSRLRTGPAVWVSGEASSPNVVAAPKPPVPRRQPAMRQLEGPHETPQGRAPAAGRAKSRGLVRPLPRPKPHVLPPSPAVLTGLSELSLAPGPDASPPGRSAVRTQLKPGPGPNSGLPLKPVPRRLRPPRSPLTNLRLAKLPWKLHRPLGAARVIFCSATNTAHHAGVGMMQLEDRK